MAGRALTPEEEKNQRQPSPDPFRTVGNTLPFNAAQARQSIAGSFETPQFLRDLGKTAGVAAAGLGVAGSALYDPAAAAVQYFTGAKTPRLMGANVDVFKKAWSNFTGSEGSPAVPAGQAAIPPRESPAPPITRGAEYTSPQGATQGSPYGSPSPLAGAGPRGYDPEAMAAMLSAIEGRTGTAAVSPSASDPENLAIIAKNRADYENAMANRYEAPGIQYMKNADGTIVGGLDWGNRSGGGNLQSEMDRYLSGMNTRIDSVAKAMSDALSEYNSAMSWRDRGKAKYAKEQLSILSNLYGDMLKTTYGPGGMQQGAMSFQGSPLEWAKHQGGPLDWAKQGSAAALAAAQGRSYDAGARKADVEAAYYPEIEGAKAYELTQRGNAYWPRVQGEVALQRAQAEEAQKRGNFFDVQAMTHGAEKAIGGHDNIINYYSQVIKDAGARMAFDPSAKQDYVNAINAANEYISKTRGQREALTQRLVPGLPATDWSNGSRDETEYARSEAERLRGRK